MENPWANLPDEPPFVLEMDRQSVHLFNTTKASAETWVQLELLPEPFLGNPLAPIVLLNLNVGFTENEILLHHENSHFIETNRKNLLHEDQPYPFYLLDPKNAQASGYYWWVRKLKRLIPQFGLSRVANNIFCVEYFPYHSQRFHEAAAVESQKYSFFLVQEALKRNALIIIMRSQKLWFNAVKDLEKYDNLYLLLNSQNVVVSQNNCPDGFPKIVKLLNEAT